MHNPSHLYIIGASLASLKFLSLIRSHFDSNTLRISLIAPNDKFIFLPLLPNYLHNVSSQSHPVVSVEEFCRSRSCSFYQSLLVQINQNERTIITSNNSFKYDFLVSARGSSSISLCQQQYWSSIFHDLSTSDSKPYFIERFNLADFEICHSLLESKRKFITYNNVRSFSCHPIFSSNPFLYFFAQLLDSVVSHEKPSLSICKSPPTFSDLDISEVKSSFIPDSHHFFLGGEHASHLGLQATAQFSSFDAKMLTLTFLLSKFIGFRGASEFRNFNSKNYRPRGHMLYLSSRNSAIWLNLGLQRNITKLLQASPHLSGHFASLIRSFFYNTQVYLFYRTFKPFNLLMLIYKLWFMLWALPFFFLRFFFTFRSFVLTPFPFRSSQK